MNPLNKIGTIVLALIFLLATTGVLINKHYCGGRLASATAYFTGGCTCGDAEMEDDCCRNESEFIQLVEDYTPTAIDHNLNPNFVIIFVKYIVLNVLFNNVDVYSLDYVNYKPPLLERNILVLFQSFLV